MSLPNIRLAFAGAVAIIAACARPATDARQAPTETTLGQVLTLSQAHDYFGLRDLLQGQDTVQSPAILYARSLAGHAFNRLEASNQSIDAALSLGGLSDSLLFQLRALRANNLLRLARYGEGLGVADEAVRTAPPTATEAEVDDLRNLARIFRALGSTGPQTVERRDSTTLRLTNGLIPVRIEGRNRNYIFDTGANISTLSRSEATALGLRIIPAGIDVGSSSDIRNRADLAVADSLVIGGFEFRRVIFLVFDDKLLTFPAMVIRGIVGFPVIEAMGEVRLQPSGTITVPANPPARHLGNLALDGQTPLTAVRWRNERLLCRLDTGANTTDLYEPFYRRYRPWADSAGTPDSTQNGGVGGLRTLPIRRLRHFTASLGDTTFTWDTIEVITKSLAKTPAANFLDCNIGHDVLDRFREYVINFRDMSFLLR